SVPLQRPYELSFGTLRSFDTIVVEALDRDGRSGIGEATITPGGYTGLVRVAREHPLGVSALMSAIEMLEGSPLLEVGAPVRVPILGLLQGADQAELSADMDRLFAAGFRTLKFKVGTDVERDLSRVALVQSLLAGRGTFRLDANRGYTAEEGCRFASSL